MANIFICAKSGPAGYIVPLLTKEMEKLGHSVCNPSYGGDRQFDWIRDLEEIRYCDVFAFVWDALKSDVGRVQYRYAASLDKLILPIVVMDDWPSWYTEGLSLDKLPQAQFKLPALEYQPKDREGYLRLAKALRNIPSPNPLPDPLPPEPEDPRPKDIPLY